MVEYGCKHGVQRRLGLSLQLVALRVNRCERSGETQASFFAARLLWLEGCGVVMAGLRLSVNQANQTPADSSGVTYGAMIDEYAIARMFACGCPRVAQWISG